MDCQHQFGATSSLLQTETPHLQLRGVPTATVLCPLLSDASSHIPTGDKLKAKGQKRKNANQTQKRFLLSHFSLHQMVNAGSLWNKMDLLHAKCLVDTTFKDACIPPSANTKAARGLVAEGALATVCRHSHKERVHFGPVLWRHKRCFQQTDSPSTQFL